MMNPIFSFSNLFDSLFNAKILNMNISDVCKCYFLVLNEFNVLLQSLEIRNNLVFFTAYLPAYCLNKL